MSDEALETMFAECDTGVYYGWAQIGKIKSHVYPMVMSLGWNPYYQNEKRSAVKKIKKSKTNKQIFNCQFFRKFTLFTNLIKIFMVKLLESS